MKLKRLQVVKSIRGQSVLQLEGRAIYDCASDLTRDRAINLFYRLLYKRMNKTAFYNISKPMDVMAMLVASSVYGGRGASRFDAVKSDLQFNVVPATLAELKRLCVILSETADLTDPIMTLQCEYADRYQRLFCHLYGNALNEMEVDLEG